MSKDRVRESYQPLKRYIDSIHDEKLQNQDHNLVITHTKIKKSSIAATGIQTIPLERWIMHIDMDAFFASVEIKIRPELQGQPVCVGPDPKQGKGRGVVRSASYEARAYGIRSAMPVSQAHRLCPDAVFVSGEFSNYREASEEVMKILSEYGDGGRVRRASIDEAYIEVTLKAREYNHPRELAQEIQKVITERTQLPCSIGIAPNISVAKIATSMQKPKGITFVPQGSAAIAKFLDPLKVKALNGVGKRTAERLKKHRIETLGQIQRMKLSELYPVMGRHAHWLYNRAMGIDERPLIDNGSYTRKSISTDRTFSKDIEPDDVEIVYQTLKKICSRIGEKLEAKGFHFRTVTVKLRYEDYTTIQRSKSFSVATNESKVLMKTAIELFKDNQDPNRKIRLLGVKVSGLIKATTQRSLRDFF
ncbi:MAG: DNA polymerase IV [Candidatus Hodarchaeota archaeon]